MSSSRDALRNHLGPPKLLLGPLKPPCVILSSINYIKRLSINNTVTSKIPKGYRYKTSYFDSNLETPELLLGPLRSPQEAPFSRIFISVEIRYTLQFTKFQACLRHQCNDNETCVW